VYTIVPKGGRKNSPPERPVLSGVTDIESKSTRERMYLEWGQNMI